MLSALALALGAGAAGWWLRGAITALFPSPGRTVVSPAPTAERPLVPAAVPVSDVLSAPPASLPDLPSSPVLTLEARRPVWMRIVVDDRVVAARLFEAGETYTVDAASAARRPRWGRTAARSRDTS